MINIKYHAMVMPGGKPGEGGEVNSAHFDCIIVLIGAFISI